MNDELFSPDFDLGTFRYAAARYLKLLIRARWKCAPGFLSEDELNRWGLRDISTDNYPDWRLVEMAAAALGVLNRDYLPRCDSGGVAITDESTPEGRLISKLAFLVHCHEGGPYHNGRLLKVARGLRQRRTVNWEKLVDWSVLSQIRDDLDKLPKPCRRAAPEKQRTNAVEPPIDELPRNSFRRDGHDWHIRYNKGQQFLLRDSPGLFYIHQLLVHPDREYTVMELSQAKVRQGLPRRPGEVDGTSLHTTGSLNDGPILDREGMNRCRAEFDEINCELDRAKKNNDIGSVERLQAELEKLKNAVASVKSPAGKKIMLGDKCKRVGDRVTRAISRACGKIGEKDKDLEHHLLLFLKTGRNCRYSPEQPTEWTT